VGIVFENGTLRATALQGNVVAATIALTCAFSD